MSDPRRPGSRPNHPLTVDGWDWWWRRKPCANCHRKVNAHEYELIDGVILCHGMGKSCLTELRYGADEQRMLALKMAATFNVTMH